MTSQTKEELELLIDALSDNANTIVDAETEEADELANTDDRDEKKLFKYNTQKLTAAKNMINNAKAILQDLTDKN